MCAVPNVSLQSPTGPTLMVLFALLMVEMTRCGQSKHHLLQGPFSRSLGSVTSSPWHFNQTTRESHLPAIHSHGITSKRHLKTVNRKKLNVLHIDQKDDNPHNISHLLDQLLYGYDSHVRPNFGGPPIEVLIDFHIRSMGPVSEIDMTYVIDCYFRQTWTDHRLAYKSIFHTVNNLSRETDPYNIKGQQQQTNQSNQKALALSIYMLDRIWKPPTYFLNSRQSHFHTITLPNKFVRIYSNGRVLYSSRMTIKANCPMNLENFPMDTQRCPLALGSFGYTSKDLVYNWNPSRTVVINPDMKMSQFDLISVPVHAYNSSLRTASLHSSYSVLVATFHFKRHMGSFLIEVYAPCIMLVVLSWVGFWINREATADRVTLGLTTVLTMTFLGLELRNDLPKVPYLTALDYFVYISFAFISATILEFGFVHFFTKIGSGEFYFMPFHEINQTEKEQMSRTGSLNLSRSADCIADQTAQARLQSSSSRLTLDSLKRSSSWSITTQRESFELEEKAVAKNLAVVYHPSSEGIHWESRPHSRFTSLHNSLRNSLRARWNQSFRRQYRGRPKVRLSTVEEDHPHTSHTIHDASVRIQLNSVSQIDRVSRVIFPITFIAMNFIYWYIYLQAETNVQHQTMKFK